ncbi:MAG: hypothetical protein AAF942_07495, partial [Pseudomonadota bacterium]
MDFSVFPAFSILSPKAGERQIPALIASADEIVRKFMLRSFAKEGFAVFDVGQSAFPVSRPGQSAATGVLR